MGAPLMPGLPHPDLSNRQLIDLEAADAIDEGDRIRAQLLAEGDRRAARHRRPDQFDLNPAAPPESAQERYRVRDDQPPRQRR